jgi:acyl carrier protein
MSIRDAVREILGQHLDVGADDAPIEVDSYTLVSVAEAVEERFGFRVAAREMVPENFGTPARLAAYVEGKRR